MGQKQTFKVDATRPVEGVDASSNDNQSQGSYFSMGSSLSLMKNRFITMQARPQRYLGKKAVAIQLQDVTEKTRQKLKIMQQREQKVE